MNAPTTKVTDAARFNALKARGYDVRPQYQHLTVAKLVGDIDELRAENAELQERVRKLEAR